MQNPAGARAHIEAGLRAHQAGDLDAAIAAYERGLALAPEYVQAAG